MKFITAKNNKLTFIKRFLGNERGFTASEVAASLFFLGLMLGVIIILMISADFSQTRTHFYGTAPLLAQGKMSETELNPRKMINTYGIYGSDFPGFTWHVTLAAQEMPIVIFADREFKKVVVEIGLNEEYVYRLEKYIFISR